MRKNRLGREYIITSNLQGLNTTLKGRSNDQSCGRITQASPGKYMLPNATKVAIQETTFGRTLLP